MEKENVSCSNAAKHIEKVALSYFNEWANEAEKDTNLNTQAALQMLRPLLNYACKYCDAGQVLGQVDNLAAIALREVHHS